MNKELRPYWSRMFDFNWKFGLFLIIIICIPRFILSLYANVTGNYSSIGLVMMASAIAPFIFLSKYGRKEIGINKSSKYRWLLIAFILGVLASVFLYFLGHTLYDNTYENWYKYIGKSYKIPAVINANDKRILFAIMAITGMIFSPIGEELFFRGIVHSSFAKSIGQKKASLIDSSAFALTHIAHFGLVFINNKWDFFAIPSLIWLASMFLISLLFIALKKHSNSLLGPIICHSGFNLGMIYCIFYLL